MTLALGSVIYISVKPIFKIYLILAVGFYLARKNILSVDTARDFSKIVIDVLLPCLAFNKIVTNISNNNIAEIGTIAIIFCSFSAIGFVLSLLVSFFLIPKKLRNRLRGICLSIGLFPNISDLPIAYLQTFQTNNTFTTDQVDRGVAYSMIFMTLQLIVQFNLGGYYLVGMDMKNELKYQEKLELDNQLVDQVNNQDDDSDLESQRKINHDNSNNSTNSLSSSVSIQDSQMKEKENDTDTEQNINSQPSNATLKHKLRTLNDIEDLESIDSNLSNYPTADENGELSHQQFLKSKNSVRSNIQSHLNPNYNHGNLQQNSGILLKILKSNDSKVVTGSSSSHHHQDENLHKRNTSTFPSQQFQQLASSSNDLRKMPSQTMNDVIRVYSKVNELNQGKVQLQYDGAAEESPLAKIKSIQSILQNKPENEDKETLSSQDDDNNSNVSNNIKKYKNGDIEFDDLTATEKFKIISKMVTFRNINNILKKFVMLTITSCTKPVSIVTIISIIVCMVPWLKALFVLTPQAHVPNAPDNQPPLSFIMDFTAYIGQAQVPIGIILLGGTMARLEMKQMPKGLFLAALCLTIMRLVIFPIIGIAISSKLYRDGLYYNDQILHFLCNIDWCLPSATSLIYVAASYTKKDSNNHLQLDLLAIVYLSQYTLLVVCLPFVTTYTIKVSLGD